jgi:hypothetical protein
MKSDGVITLAVTVRAVSTNVQLVRADDSEGQQYLLNESVMGPLLHAVQPGDVLELSVVQVLGLPSKILRVRRP